MCSRLGFSDTFECSLDTRSTAATACSSFGYDDVLNFYASILQEKKHIRANLGKAIYNQAAWYIHFLIVADYFFFFQVLCDL